MISAHAVPTTEDTALLARIRVGDEAAFEALFRRFYRELGVYAARIDPTAGSAEEIVQEVLLRIWLRRAELPEVQSLSAYLYAAVRNLALNRRDRAGHAERWQKAKAIELAEVPAEAPGADEWVRMAELAAAIERAIAQLPPRCRQAFLLRRQENLSCAEIARLMQTTTKTVQIQIGNALKALRRELADWI